MDEYKKLLDEAYTKVKLVESGERFEIPKVKGLVEGNKTIITNFNQICSSLRRDSAHLLKFLTRELAALAVQDKDRLIFNRVLNSSFINQKIELYAKDFVICSECGKPDTEIIKQDDFRFLKCMACGAKHALTGKM
jgi:translation initiation factor 2 subunit 2